MAVVGASTGATSTNLDMTCPTCPTIIEKLKTENYQYRK